MNRLIRALKMEHSIYHLAITSCLAVGLLAMAIWTLRLIRAFDQRYIPFGARRVRFLLDYNDLFPVHLLPDRQREMASKQDVVFLFLVPYCAMCQPILAALPAFVRGYGEAHFVAVFGSNAAEMKHKIPSRVDMILKPELIEELRINMFPYALRVRSGRVIQYGLINSPDHLESILDAPGVAT